MIEVMNVAEDQESIENLHALCSLMQTIRKCKNLHASEGLLIQLLHSHVERSQYVRAHS